MLSALAWIVTVLLVGPPLLFSLIILGGGLLALTAALLHSGPRRVRETLRCPWIGRVVTADFLVRAATAPPSDVVSCTAFPDPQRITCKKLCREMAIQ
jgi:hypothetical protein